MSQRHLLGDCTLGSVAEYIIRNDVRKVLVLIGAGVSVSAGIPDFRSPQTGIYANLGKYNLNSPTDAFSLFLLRENPSIFYDIARQLRLWPGTFQPTPVHHFIRLLAEEGRLLRCCTQNIDGLERAAGVPEKLLVEAHGSFSSASCIDCHAPYDIQQNREESMSGCVSHCQTCGGIVKPDVVFFGEQLPDRFFDVLEHDTEDAEMVFIIGTSLQVHPFAVLPLHVRDCVPRVLFNMERVGGMMFRFPDDAGDDNAEKFGEPCGSDGSHDAKSAVVSSVSCSSSHKATLQQSDPVTDHSQCMHDNSADSSVATSAVGGNAPLCRDEDDEIGTEAHTRGRVSGSACRRSASDVEACVEVTQTAAMVERMDTNGDASLPVAESIAGVSQRVEDELSQTTSSSDGYAQYGAYDRHPDVGRDAFFRGDCQTHITSLANHLGLGSRLASAVAGQPATAEAEVSVPTSSDFVCPA